jgi:hypothetical protein
MDSHLLIRGSGEYCPAISRSGFPPPAVFTDNLLPANRNCFGTDNGKPVAVVRDPDNAHGHVSIVVCSLSPDRLTPGFPPNSCTNFCYFPHLAAQWIIILRPRYLFLIRHSYESVLGEPPLGWLVSFNALPAEMHASGLGGRMLCLHRHFIAQLRLPGALGDVTMGAG